MLCQEPSETKQAPNAAKDEMNPPGLYMKPDTLYSFILNHCEHESQGGKSVAVPTSFRMCLQECD